jgi:hypothetical protein
LSRKSSLGFSGYKKSPEEISSTTRRWLGFRVDLIMEKKDLKLFLHKKVKLNIKTNDNERFYAGEIASLNDDFFMFKDKFGLDILVRYDAVVSIEPISKDKIDSIFGGNKG